MQKIIDTSILSQVASYFERLESDIEFTLALDDSDLASQLQSFAHEVASCSGRVQVRVVDETSVVPVTRRPVLGVSKAGQSPRIWFAGLPMGHEFTSFILACLQSSGYPIKESPASLNRARTSNIKANLEVFVSMSCHNCPDVVQALNALAVVNEGVIVTMVDGGAYAQEMQQRAIMAVPSVAAGQEVLFAGKKSFDEILQALSGPDGAKAGWRDEKVFDVLVAGGGPAGAAAAVYAARKGLKVAVVASRIGGQTNDTMGIENFISVLETTGPKFSADLRAHLEHYNVELHTGQDIARMTPAGAEEYFSVFANDGSRLRGKTLIVASGARWRTLNVPGEEQYKNRGVAFCPHCDGPLFKDKDVFVVGGGNSGVEAALDLAGIARSVTLIEFSSALKADSVLVEKLHQRDNVHILLNTQTLAVEGDGSRMTGLQVRDRTSGEESSLSGAGVFIQIGLVPNTDWLEGIVEMNKFKEVVIDQRNQTSVPGLFAAGDCTTVPYKQIIIAASEGAKAALSAFDHIVRH